MNSYGPFTVALPSAPNVPTVLPSVDFQATRVKFINGSPYTLFVDLHDGKNSNAKIMPNDRDVLITGPQFNGSISYVAQQDLATAGQAPASILYIETYEAHETVNGTYPSQLNWLSSIGNSIVQAQQVFQTGQPQPTAAVEATPNASFAAAPHLLEALINNDGTFTLGDNGSSGGGLIISSSSAGLLGAAQFAPTSGASVPAVTYIGRAPVQLKTGNQETGYCSGLQNNVNNTGTTGGPANFKTTMSNIPSSITLTVASSSNAPAPTAGNITLYGFSLFWTPTAAGTQSFVEATYVTVGN